MLFAENLEGVLVEASQAAKEEKYICRGCGEAVRLRAVGSKSKSVHFAHLPGSQCEWQHADMSEWHREWQMRFPEACREVGVEQDGVKHRADVLIYDTVVEFQHSPIPLEEFRARNEFYLGCGKRLIWVFDMSEKIKTIGHGTLELKRKKYTFDGYNYKTEDYDILLESDNQLYLLYSDARMKTFLCYPKPISKELFVLATSRFVEPRFSKKLENAVNLMDLIESRKRSNEPQQQNLPNTSSYALKRKLARRRFHF